MNERLKKQLLVGVIMFTGSVCGLRAGDIWCEGRWDSTLYGLNEKPRTVALRIKVTDSYVKRPISKAVVTLRGEYPKPGVKGKDLKADQLNQFEMSAKTDHDGIVVFALGWKKPNPWTTVKQEPRGARKPITIDFDDIEKVKEIEVSKERHGSKRIPYTFDRLLDGEKNEEAFEKAWRSEPQREDAKLCVMDLGADFLGYDDPASKRLEFFDRIREENYAVVFTKPQDWQNKDEGPQSLCGPYLVYNLDVSLTEGEKAEPSRLKTMNLKKTEIVLPGLEKRKVEFNRIGLDLEKLSDPMHGYLGLPDGVEGLFVWSVKKGSQAEKRGVRRGMVIESADWMLVKDEDSLDKQLEKKLLGDKVTLGLWERRDTWGKVVKEVTILSHP